LGGIIKNLFLILESIKFKKSKMEILKNIIGMIHTLAASVSIIAGAYVLLKIKGDIKHKKWGKCYFYAMLLNNLSA
jgi:uncharacterized membrane protein